MKAIDCRPEHGPHHARGLCGRCYLRAWRAERRASAEPRWIRTVELVERAERMLRELEAAGDYAMIEPTWPAVAQQLGVKPETLNRYRYRAREYLERAS